MSDLDDPKRGYPELANELRKLPEFYENTQQSQIAVQRIATLALQSNDPEVKEAFQIILRGGTSPPLPYPVPGWNTELQALFWLAEQTVLGRNDTLAQALAIVNGLWIATGDNSVGHAVYQDIGDLLSYFRETSGLQRSMGYPELQNYPLKAKVLLGWTGNTTQVFGAHHLISCLSSPLTLEGYRWNAVSTDTLKKMREFIRSEGWALGDVSRLPFQLEDHFRYLIGNWDYVTYGDPKSSKITVNGELVWNYHIGNVEFQLERLTENGRILGDCVDQSCVVDSFLKASGIPTTFIQKWRLPTDAHMNVLYYDPTTQGIRGVPFQLNNVGMLNGTAPEYAIYFPPIQESGYLNRFTLNSNGLVWYYTGFSVPKNLTSLQLFEEFTGNGVPVQSMQDMDVQWESVQSS